jgi:FlaA1/EpsC-like NDP-sugar epimerase
LLGAAWHDGTDALRRALDPLVERWSNEGLRVAVYGAGVHTEQLLRSSRLLRAPLVGLVDRNGDHHGGPLWGMPVVSPERIMELAPDVVLISSKAFQHEINRLLETLVPEQVERVMLYGADGDVRCSTVGGLRAVAC